jgi:glycosyltransferase involved in cell wall biosynthesis
MSRVALVTNVCTHYRAGLFRRLSQDHDLEIFLTADETPTYRPDDYAVDTRGLSLRRVGGALDLRRSLASGGFDVVVAGLTGRSSLVASVIGAHAARVPLILWVGIWEHPSTLFHRLSRPFVRSLYRRADGIFVYGSHVADYIQREAQRTAGVFELPQAVDNDGFSVAPGSSVAEGGRFPSGQNGVRACFVGRLADDKGVDVLLRAMASTDATLQLDIIGTGRLEPQLRELANDLDLDERVRFRGAVTQERLPAKLREADFLVLPSVTTRTQKEPWGFVVNEAMNCGLPVIASDAVGAAAGGLVIDSVTGRVVPEGDVAALAAAMQQLASDPSERHELALRAREHVRRWSYDAAAEAFSSGIDAVLTGRPS